MAPVLTIRRAGVPDAEPLKALRLRALSDHPDAFLITRAEEARNDFGELLSGRWATIDNQVLVAERGRALVGMCGFFRDARPKVRHRMTVWGMYVAPEARGHDVGQALLHDALRRMRTLGDVTHVHLAVTLHNTHARALYERLGFVTWGVEPAAMRLDGSDLDEAHMVLEVT